MHPCFSFRRFGVVLGLLVVLLPVRALGNEAPDLVRVVVELAGPPLATYWDTIPALPGVVAARTPDLHLDVGAAASRAYLRHLDRSRRAFERRLAAVSPGADVHWRYRIAFNGLAAVLRRDTLDAVRALPGVVAVTETYRLEPELDQSRNLLDLATMWSAYPASVLGAGSGRRVALIDAGLNPLHPFFSPDGYTAPAGYPKAERVAGGVRTPLPITPYASNKVIVGSVYTPPEGTSTPWGPGSNHGTHVAGIMAGVSGTYTFSAGTQSWDLPMSGMLPGAYIMSYTLGGDSAEFLAAIEDVVADKADALNISLGHSYWLTGDPVHDPLRKALEAATDAGTVVAASAGNAGSNGDSTVTGSWKLSPKIITVASSSNGRIFANRLSVTGSGTPPASLRNRIAVPAAVPAPPIAATISGPYVVAPGGAGPDAGRACTALPPDAVAGKFVLVQRGGCTFEVKKNNVVNSGGIGMIVYNDQPDLPTVIRFNPPVIPAVMITRVDGRAMVTWAKTDSAPEVTIEPPTERLSNASPDVVSSFSSRGPAPIMTIKPDIAAPGFNILSSVVDGNTGAVVPPFFDLLSGTSMSTPHITGLAAATKGLHPTWTVEQIKSALMNTAETDLHLDTTGNMVASVRDRGAGRVRPARLVSPQLTFDPPSASFGLVRSGGRATATVVATDMRTVGGASAWRVRVRPVKGHSRVVVSPTPSFATAPRSQASFTVTVDASAPAGDYEGFVEVRGPGGAYTVPYWLRVQDPATDKDVLLIDWDRNVTDQSKVYKDALKTLGLTFDVFDGGTSTASIGNPGPTLLQLQGYRTVVLITGDNASSWSAAHVGGSFPLQGYLLGGGRLVLVGQDLQSQIVYNQNQGSDFLLTSMGGWIDGFMAAATPAACQTIRSDTDFYGPLTPADSVITTVDLLGGIMDLSVNAGDTRPGSQTRPDAGREVWDADDENGCIGLYNADHIAPHARVLGLYVVTERTGVGAVPRVEEAAATGVAPDPTLERPKPAVPWAAAVMHVGIEGIIPGRGELSRAAALGRLYDFVNDAVTVDVSYTRASGGVDLVARATSASDTRITRYRWSFGDGSPEMETTTNRARHAFGRSVYTVRVEAVDALTRSGVGVATVDTRTSVAGARRTRPESNLPATEVDPGDASPTRVAPESSHGTITRKRPLALDADRPGPGTHAGSAVAAALLGIALILMGSRMRAAHGTRAQ
jgi:subtilisin family serine protease